MLPAVVQLPNDLVLTRSVPFVTLLHAVTGGPRHRTRKVLAPDEVRAWIGSRVDELALEGLTLIAVALGRPRRRASTIRVRSILETVAGRAAARAFVHVEEDAAPVDARRPGAGGGVHVIACRALPTDLLFVECAPRDDSRGAPRRAALRALERT
jgi:hypothetical protein